MFCVERRCVLPTMLNANSLVGENVNTPTRAMSLARVQRWPRRFQSIERSVNRAVSVMINEPANRSSLIVEGSIIRLRKQRYLLLKCHSCPCCSHSIRYLMYLIVFLLAITSKTNACVRVNCSVQHPLAMPRSTSAARAKYVAMDSAPSPSGKCESARPRFSLADSSMGGERRRRSDAFPLSQHLLATALKS